MPVSLPVAGLPAHTMWPLMKLVPQAFAQAVSDWMGSVAVFSVSERLSWVELVRPQP
ncbi:hypothetical protein SGLAM104S_06035 [Streptomyces glaucescens]